MEKTLREMWKLLLFALIPVSVAYISLMNCSPNDKEDIPKTRELRWEIRKLLGEVANEYEISDLLKIYSKCGSSWLTLEEATRFNATVLQKLKTLKIALIVVDYQNDFVSGSLNVATGDAQQDPLSSLPYINHLIENPGIDRVVYTQDWHPANHISFVNHANDDDRVLSTEDRERNLAHFETVRFIQPNATQTLYPSHCVPGTWGALLHEDMLLDRNALYIHKGTEPLVDSYSAFKNNNGQKLELDDKLKAEGINAVISCGLAYDICVHFTLKDASDLGYLTAVSPDCSKGFSKKGIQEAHKTFKEQDVAVLSAEEADEVVSRSLVPIQWMYYLAKRSNNK